MNKDKLSLENMFKIGRPECAITFGIIGFVVTAMLLLLGVWKSILLVAVVAICAFIGGVKEKREAFNRFIDFITFNKATTKSVYHHEEDFKEKVRKALQDDKNDEQ